MPSIFSKRRSVDAGTTANGPAGVVRAKPAEAAHVRAKRSVDANVNHQLDRNGSDVSAAGTSGGGGDRSSGDMAGTATGTDTGVQGEREGGRVNGDRESEAAAVSSNAMAPRSPPPSAYPGAGVDKTPTKERRGSKIKSFLRGSFSEKDTNSAHDPASPTSAGGGGTGLKQRLTSPSTIFKRASISEPQASPTTSSRSQVQATPTASPPNTASNRLSAALFPENFSLSSTNSPESPRNGNRQSWQPSYPLVIPDNAAESGAYADVAPDGSLPPKQLDRTLPMPMPTSAPGVSENELRRSMKAAKRNDASGAAPAQGMTTSGETGTAPVDTPGLLNSWEPLKPDVQKPSSTDGAVASADVSTTVGQRSISAAQNTSPTEPNDVQSPAQASSQSPKPVLSLDLGPSLSRTLPDTASPARANAISTSPTSTSHSPIAAFSPAYTPGVGAPGTPISPIPGMIVGPNGKLRPAIISRKTTHIHSPPMPQPIKNLPTLSGLPGFSMPPSAIGAEGQGQRTPAGMPKTPGWGGFGFGMGGGTPGAGAMAGTNGPLTGSGAPRTPGGGFPWAMGLGGGEKKDKGKQAMSEEELRKMKRAMPVMLRQASTKPVQEEGGDVGADDDDDNDDESESEADDTKAGDSEDEDEPAGTASTSAAAKAKSKGKAKEKDKSKSSGLSALDRLKGKRAVSTSSPLKIGTVQEEDSTVPGSSPGLAAGAGAAAVKPPKTSPSLFERRASKSPQLASGAFPPPQASPPLADVPEGKVVAGEEEPKWSIGDKPKTQSIWTRFGTPGGKTPAAASSGGMDEGGYFGSQPSSSNATAQATPAMASTTAKGKGRAVDNQTLSPPRTDVPLDTPSDIGSRVGEDSEDEGEGTEEGGPTATTTSTSVRSTTSPSARPGLYTQASQSLVNLRPRASMEGNEINDAPTLGAKPPLITIPSGEEIGTRAGPPKIEMPKGPFSMIGRVPQTPMWAKPPPTPATPGGAAKVFWAKGGKDQGQLKRRRSADDLTGVPPTYTPPGPGVYVPRPREDEGREKLPGYWCAVHIEGSLSRKMEFSAPGVQSRDRSWKKYYFILRGTSLFVYKFDPHRFPVKDIGVGANVVISDVPEVESEEHLHVHVPPEQRRNSVSGSSVNSLAATAAANARRASMSMSTDASGVRRPSVGTIGPQGQGAGVVVSGERRGSVASIGRDRSGSIGGASGSGLGLELGGRRGSGAGLPPPSTSSGSSTLVGTVPAPGEKDSALFTGTPKPKAPATAPPPSTSATTNALAHFQTNHLVRQYTLQNAESGLAADYVKRKNVVRVRSEGEQFLLQTDGAREVVDWIEAFQAATNVSLDLDDRPMPKIITLPRRRRRRPAGAASGTATPARADGANPDTADTEAGNVAAVEAAERAARERDRDLAQDQGTAERATG